MPELRACVASSGILPDHRLTNAVNPTFDAVSNTFVAIMLPRAGLLVLRLILAIALTLATVRIQRRGPEQVVFSNLCGPTASDLCYRPVLKGGFPVAYLFDTPGVSVENQLAFMEDRFRPVAFGVDVALYFATTTLVAWLVRRLRIISRPIFRRSDPR
jgi:hypothetical protein